MLFFFYEPIWPDLKLFELEKSHYLFIITI